MYIRVSIIYVYYLHKLFTLCLCKYRGGPHPTYLRDSSVKAQPSTAMSWVAASRTSTKNSAVIAGRLADCSAASAQPAPASMTAALAS